MKNETKRLKDFLKEKGYKLTRQRRATIEAIIANQGRHMSAEEVYLEVKKTCPEIGLATVYRTILLLAETGMLDKHNFDDKRNRYELNNPDEDHHHHHLICIKCGGVTEVEEDLLDFLEEKIKVQHHFVVIDHKVKFSGYCAKCR